MNLRHNTLATACFLAAATLITAGFAASAYAFDDDGWSQHSVRNELKPQFSYEKAGGPAGQPVLRITSDGRPGLDGAWVKRFPVTGGRVYRFSALRKTENVPVPRRSAIVKITWQDDRGNMVPGDGDKARPEYPRETGNPSDGWQPISEMYPVPDKATQARVELRFRWSQNGAVRYSAVSLEPTAKQLGRTVRLATVHYRPSGGKTPAENREQFAEYIAEAAAKGADLVCLPESLTLYGTGLKYAEAAEPIPGPSTDYFGSLAKKHNLYIVAGLLERSEDLVYNTAALLGPGGELVGKYRKVCLPREEIEGGVAPGSAYPVFETRFGRLGMMICWDVHFPEVARNLSNNGAEVIAMPIWGGNPTLARARAIENQVFLVTSTYTDPEKDWMKSGVFDKEGRLLVTGHDWGKVLVVEVDLDKKKQWPWLGNFKARIHRERPANGFQN